MSTLRRYSLQKLTAPQIVLMWPLIEADLLAHKELWEERQTLEDFKGNLLSGKFQLLTLLNSEDRVQMYLMTRLQQTKNGVTLAVLWGFGRYAEDWILGLEILEEFARSIGCTTLDVQGRPGWARMLKGQGYKLAWQVVRKDLTAKHTEH